MRCRSMFYASLGRLLMVELGEDEERFHTFMLPLTGVNYNYLIFYYLTFFFFYINYYQKEILIILSNCGNLLLN